MLSQNLVHVTISCQALDWIIRGEGEGRTQGRSHKDGKTAQAGLFPIGHAGPTCSSYCPDDLVLMLGPSVVSRDVWKRNALC